MLRSATSSDNASKEDITRVDADGVANDAGKMVAPANKYVALWTAVKLNFLGQRDAQRVDEELMSSKYGFSIDQLMELAGLSVACAVGKEFAPEPTVSTSRAYNKVLIVAGPGNNGGDALVAARHLKGLVTQCERLEIQFIEQVPTPTVVDSEFDVILDGIFGFSFEGSIRAPFDEVITTLKQCQAPIVSIDIPSGWHVEKGNENGAGLEPQMLVSLTAPKLCAQHFEGPGKIHYVGGRFVPRSLAVAFDLEIPPYPGVEQCVKI